MKSRVKKYFRYWILKAKKISFIGLQGIPIYDVASFFIKEIKNEDITLRATAMAFNLFIALLPAIIFLFSLFPYIPVDDLGSMVLGNMERFMPAEAYILIESTVKNILLEERGGLLSFSFLITTYFAVNGIRCAIASFNKNLPTFKHRNILQDFYVSFLLILMLSLLVLAALVLMISGGWALTKAFDAFSINQNTLLFYSLELLRWGLIFSSIYFAIALLYRYGVAANKKWGMFSVGAMFATLLCLLSSGVFSYYVNHFSQYNKFYGSLGAIIIIMLWFYFNSLSILVGFELNTSIVENKNRLSVNS